MENWIKKEGDLPPHTRRSWDTAKHLLDMSKTVSLDSFGLWAKSEEDIRGKKGSDGRKRDKPDD